MHIVFLVGGYFPNYSAVGNCVGNVAQELISDHQVTVISYKDSDHQNSIEYYGNQKIIRINTNLTKKNKFNDKAYSINKFRQKKIYFTNKFSKFIRVSKLILSKETIRRDIVKSYIDALNSIEENIDIIIPASMPFESVVAATTYKKLYQNKVKLVPYLFDHFTYNSTLHRHPILKILKKKNHLKLEQETLEQADFVLAMNHHRNHFIKHFNQYTSKINYVEHPLLKKIAQEHSNIKEDTFNFVYTGSFYKKIRNPEHFLDVAQLILTKMNGVFNIYSFGDCEHIVKSYNLKHPLKIFNHGLVPRDEAYKAMMNSDFLIAIGNKDITQVPSKVFEYLSLGKPIIYFYSRDEDLNLKILESYPLAICLKQDKYNIEENSNYIVDFSKSNIGKEIDFSEVESIYYMATPKYTSDLILSKINNI